MHKQLSPSLPLNHQDYGLLTKKKKAPSHCLHKSKKLSLADQFISSPHYLPPTSVFVQSNPAALSHYTQPSPLLLLLGIFLLLGAVVSGYLLRDILHCGYCSTCLLRKEVGRNETATHTGFVVLPVSPCIFLPGFGTSRPSFVNRYSCCTVLNM